jgi:hypothetical protein
VTDPYVKLIVLLSGYYFWGVFSLYGALVPIRSANSVTNGVASMPRRQLTHGRELIATRGVAESADFMR